MVWYDYLSYYINSFISVFILVECYNLLNSHKKFNIKDIGVIAFISLLFLLNTLLNYTLSKVIIFYLFLSICLKIIYKDSWKKVLISAVLIYLILMFVETICGMLMYFFPYSNAEEVNNVPLMKNTISTIIMLITLIFFIIKKVRNFIKKAIGFLCERKYITVVIFVVIITIFFSSITFKNALNYHSLSSLIINIIVFATTIIITFINIINLIKRNKAEEKEQILLDFMKKYEYVIDNDRINRHEMLNNLLIIKSFKNKNTKKFDELMDNLIEEYKNNKYLLPHNIYNLPSGLKGIIYYKIADMERLKINSSTNISKKVITKLDRIDSKVYTKICKILGIIIDNAIEAASATKDKEMIIEIYERNKNICFEISNSIKKKSLDINKINQKKYSSKGKNRGYGLYIVNKIIQNSKELELIQKVENKTFISILILKNSSKK